MIATAQQTRPRTTTTAPPVVVAQIRLADDEYGNRIMEAAAREVLATSPHVDVCYVAEHAGWGIWYARSTENPERLIVVGSANDRARYSGEAAQIREQLATRERLYLSPITRS